MIIELGEVIYGGVGSGLYGMLVFVIVAVFIAGLMVGRTPEYLGQENRSLRDEDGVARDPDRRCLLVLIGTAVAVVVPAGKAAVFNPGPHGFSEILYAFSSTVEQQRQRLCRAGHQHAVLQHRRWASPCSSAAIWLEVPALAIAGSLAAKKNVPVSAGTLPTHTPLFIGWLIAVVIIVGALSFFPALALGPIVEHLADDFTMKQSNGL